MAFSIDKFTSKAFVSDIYRANLFEVKIPDMGEQVSIMVKGASIPASTVDMVEVPFQNRIVKIAGDRTFEDWTVTVINDAGFVFRSYVEGWMDDIQSHSFVAGQIPNDYKKPMSVKPLKRDGSSAGSEYKFTGAFPTAIDAIDLAWGTDGAPSEFGITFAYDFWSKGGVTS